MAGQPGGNGELLETLVVVLGCRSLGVSERKIEWNRKIRV